MSSGIFNTVGFGAETSYGTAVEPTLFIPLKESDGVVPNMDVQFVEAIKGTPAKNKGSFAGKVEMEGGFDSDLYSDYIGAVLRSALGSVASDLQYGESTVYKHIFAEIATKPSYTIEQNMQSIIKRYNGYVVKDFSIEAKVGEVIGFKFGGFAKNQATEDATSAVYEVGQPFNFANTTVLTIGGTDVLPYVEELSVEYDNALQSRYALGDNYIKDLHPGQSEAKGKMMMYVNDVTKEFLEEYISQNNQEIVIKFERDVIGTGSKRTVQITLPSVALTATSTKLSFDYNAFEVEYEAVEESGGSLINIELINLISSYNPA